MTNQTLGSFGEKVASKHLLEHGFQIINRNVRSRFGEIDIIAYKEGSIHFVEVKTRIGDSHGKPYEAVGYYKMNHMRKSAELYVLQKRLSKHKLSLDVVSIILYTDQSIKELKFFENITQ